jgi:CheY-like chemotaxis protein
VGIVRAGLQDLTVTGSFCSLDSTETSETLRCRHFDGIILDCNDPEWCREILTKIRTGGSNRQSPVIAIVNSVQETPALQKSGVNQTICKPLSSDTLKSHLRSALDAMQSEHFRYFRYPVSLPVLVGAAYTDLAAGRLLNVSQEGLALRLKIPPKPGGAVIVRFDLPSIEPYLIEAKGEIAWGDADGRIGVKISHMPADACRRYEEWLDVLDAQLEFRRFTEDKPRRP